jgi:hypothetical protein
VIIYVIYHYSWYNALKYVSVTVNQIIANLGPVFLSIVMLKEEINVRKICTIIVGISGMMFTMICIYCDMKYSILGVTLSMITTFLITIYKKWNDTHIITCHMDGSHMDIEVDTHLHPNIEDGDHSVDTHLHPTEIDSRATEIVNHLFPHLQNTLFSLSITGTIISIALLPVIILVYYLEYETLSFVTSIDVMLIIINVLSDILFNLIFLTMSTSVITNTYMLITIPLAILADFLLWQKNNLTVWVITGCIFVIFSFAMDVGEYFINRIFIIPLP